MRQRILKVAYFKQKWEVKKKESVVSIQFNLIKSTEYLYTAFLYSKSSQSTGEGKHTYKYSKRQA